MVFCVAMFFESFHAYTRYIYVGTFPRFIRYSKNRWRRYVFHEGGVCIPHRQVSAPGNLCKVQRVDDDVFLFVLAETKNRSQAPYIPLGRYVPHEAV